jgi:hypothetical protein
MVQGSQSLPLNLCGDKAVSDARIPSASCWELPGTLEHKQGACSRKILGTVKSPRML